MQPDLKNTRSVLFVCLGNICRSPLAEGVFRAQLRDSGLQDHITVDSAGTGTWHVDCPPDPRSIETANIHGLDITAQRGRQVAPEDFDNFDLILAMDRSNFATLTARAPSSARKKIFLFMDITLGQEVDVPDPYYDDDGFKNVYRMLREGSSALLRSLSGDDGSLRGNPSSTT